MRTATSFLAGLAATAGLVALLAALAPSHALTAAPALRALVPRTVSRLPPDAAPEETTQSVRGTGVVSARGRPGEGTRRSGGGGRQDAPRAAPRGRRDSALAAKKDGGARFGWPERLAWRADGLGGLALPAGMLDGARGVDGGAAVAGGAGPGDGFGAGRGGGDGSGASAGGGMTRRAVARFSPQPPYPQSARAREESGFVEALIRVSDSGAVVAVDVTGGSSQSAFEESVRSTVMRWRFDPAMRGGKPIPTTLRRRFEFRMVDG